MPAPVRALDDYVEAFERARQEQEGVDLALYLPPGDDPLYREVLRELVRVDLEFGWESNRPRSLDDYRERFPELFRDPDSLQAVAFEEYRLRRRAGQAPDPRDYARRYGVRTDDWPGSDPDSLPGIVEASASARTYREFRLAQPVHGSILLEPEPAEGAAGGLARLFRELLLADRNTGGRLADGLAVLPKAGSACLGFELVAELGAGAFGKVFLARQEALADRPVALKVSPDVGTEAQALARLQHTHIVPIYSVHRGGVLQAVCMPYCGAVTVADVVRFLQAQPELPRDGAALLAALAGKPRPPEAPPHEGPAPPVRAALAQRCYPDAVLWLGGCLAAGLAHAHERGILHRDIKPANVLLTDEGLPMLLDFNISHDARHNQASAALVGGTLPYMAPEQLLAFRDRAGEIDGRADVYSLGLVLFELLTGQFPFSPVRLPLSDDSDAALNTVLTQALQERQEGPPCPRHGNPDVSPAAASIVRHCLEPDPARRYPSAAALREDIERHLANQPLRYAPEPSTVERLRKWSRRHPRLGLRLSLAAGCILLLVAVVFGWLWQRLEQANWAGQQMQSFQADFRHAQFLLGTQPDSTAQVQAGEEACRRALDRYGVLTDPAWQKRWRLTALPADRQRAVKEQLGELLMLLAGTVAESGGPIDEALDHNSRAASCFDDEPPILAAQRAWLEQRQQGKRERFDVYLERAGPLPATTVRDRYLAAREHAHWRRYAEARRLLEEVVAVEPGNSWAWFLLGVCHDGLGKDREAVSSYTVCVALDPEFLGAHINRGLAHLRRKEFARARADLDQVIAAWPDRPETYLDRALARRGLGDLKGAIADLEEAEARGIPLTRVYFLRAAIRRQAGDEAGARRDEAEGMKRRPTDGLSWVARGLFRLRNDPKGALADYDQALARDPHLRTALQNKAHVLAERLGRQKEACDVLERLLELYPGHVAALSGQAVVLARLKQRDRAHERIGEALARDPTGEVRYQAACVYALTSRQAPRDAETALAYLGQAIDLRYGLQFLEHDADLAPLRDRLAYRRLLRAAELLRQAGKKR